VDFNKAGSAIQLLVVADALNNFCEGDILAYIGDLDGDAFALFGVGNNYDEHAFNTRDHPSLVKLNSNILHQIMHDGINTERTYSSEPDGAIAKR